MPFINEDLKKQTQAVLKRTRLGNIRVHYINGSSSSRIFTPPKEKQCCPDPCDTCYSSTRTNQCLKKTVYMLTLFLGTQTKKTAIDSLARSDLVVRDASGDLTKTLVLIGGGLSPYFPHTPPLKEMSSWTLQRWPNRTITISNLRRDKKKLFL